MYIALTGLGSARRFELRRSVPVSGGYAYEVLVDLGKNLGGLARFERHGISLSEELLTRVTGVGVHPDELEQALIVWAPRGWSPPGERGRTWQRTRVLDAERDAVLAMPAFDRRRLAFLRTGEVNLSRIDALHPRLFRVLHGKCRDELEQMFLRLERDLPPGESSQYVYAALNLQRHFSSLAARSMPESIPVDTLDQAFLHEYCLLLGTDAFWHGAAEARMLARRYACLHFDHDFPRVDPFARIFRNFMHDSRKPTPRPRLVPPDRVRELFGLGPDELRAMSRRDFARLFRSRAMTMHPDRGGDHDTFVELLDLYKRIVRSKS